MCKKPNSRQWKVIKELFVIRRTNRAVRIATLSERVGCSLDALNSDLQLLLKPGCNIHVEEQDGEHWLKLTS